MGTVTDGCAASRTALGAYVLGALDPDERAQVRSHLVACPACRDELVHLAGLPGLLGRLSLADVTDHPDGAAAATAPDAVAGPSGAAPAAGSGAVEGARAVGGAGGVEPVLAAIRRSRRTARRRLAVAAAALALVVAGISVGVTVAVTPAGDRPPGRMLTATDATSQVEATVWVAGDPAGSAFTVRLEHVPPGSHCVLVAQAVDGRRETAASWAANYYGDVEVRGSSGIAPSRLARLIVVRDTGQQLVVLPVRRA